VLAQIIKECRESGGIINLNDLSHRLGIDRSALDGMMDTLVKQGKLQAISAIDANCRNCSGSCQGCTYASESMKGYKAFQLAID
jgi:hypothetical protein